MAKMSKVIGIALAATAIFFGSCSNDSGSDNEATTNNEFRIQGVAYPGVNYITWNCGKTTKDIPTTCYRDDGVKVSVSGDGIWDSDVEDGEEYTYTLYKGTGDRLDTASGAAATITLKAIKPAYIKDDGSRMTALDLVDYENGSDDANASKDGVVAKENIDVKIDKTGNFVVVSFPEKDYLDYAVKLYKGNSAELLQKVLLGSDNGSMTKAALIKTNKAGLYTKEASITGSGNYQVEVVVTAKNDKDASVKKYAPAKVYSSMVPVEGLDVASGMNTTDIKVAFTNDKNTEVRVEWKPAIKLDGKTPYETVKYKVYACDADTLEVKEVSEKILSEKKEGETVYYVDTKVILKSGKASDSRNLFYRVILSDNERYESGATTDSGPLFWYSPNEDDASSVYDVTPVIDQSTSTLSFEIQSYNFPDSGTVSVNYVVFADADKVDYGSNDYSALILDSEHKKAASAFKAVRYNPADNTSVIVYYEAVTSEIMKENQLVAYEVIHEESGKKDSVIGAVYYTYKDSDGKLQVMAK